MRPQNIGTYRQRVTLFDVPEAVVSSYGVPSQAPVQIGTFWAEVRPLRGREMVNVRSIWPTPRAQAGSGGCSAFQRRMSVLMRVIRPSLTCAFTTHLPPQLWPQVLVTIVSPALGSPRGAS